MSALLDQSAALLMLAVAQGIVILMGRIDLANAALCSFFCVLAGDLAEYPGPAQSVGAPGGRPDRGSSGWLHMLLPDSVVRRHPGRVGIDGGAALLVSGASAVSLMQNFELVDWFYASQGWPLASSSAPQSRPPGVLVAKTAEGVSDQGGRIQPRAPPIPAIRLT
jgi:ribose/xylose/arabinose/galactoside ABC-type transport system permease subunit